MVKPNKEIHFYSYLDPDVARDGYYSWDETNRAIKKNIPRINTLQMGFLSGSLFEKGYRIFVHETPNSRCEIKLGCDNERTNREIRVAHNLFKMWRSGEFDEKETQITNEATKEADP